MDRFPRSDSIVQQTRSGLQTYMAQVYGWMTVGLLLTAFIAWYAANTPELMMFIFSSKITFFGLIIAQLALVFVLVAKILVLSELQLRDTPMIAALAAACAAGRGCSVLLMFGHRYARDEGLGNLFIGKVSGRDTFVTLIITALVTVALLGAQGVLALLVTMVAIYLLGWLLKRTLGGQTGDTLGAAIELGEVIFLLALL